MNYSYLVKRGIQIIPVVFGILIISFLMIHLAPGDAVFMFIGESGADPEFEAAIRTRLGLDKSLFEQFILYIKGIFSGDLGRSFVLNEDVSKIIFDRAIPTIILMLSSISFGAIFGILIGVYAASKPYSMRDNISMVIALFLYSLPNFWLGQMLIIVFSVNWGLLPVSGMESMILGDKSFLFDRFTHLVLPTITLGSTLAAFVMRFVRSSMIDVLGQDYILTAKSKGLSERKIFFKHALKNALLPVITYIGLRLGYMLSGAVVIESVFGWPGLGLLMLDALFERDYPLIMGLFIVISLSVTIITFIVDILYTYLDPRIRLK
ncbi:MAG: ABC transporter permease [Pelagibacteraceae bacterium]|jgi:peptide/nickel transport system permease protein|nr:ABC transporter permease [Pelagibacteraceae bacterium]MBT7011093.1 ABC transporter permease [Flavobacteriaceae bacterium]|tara:strand:- start:3695 stop:4657 length:963 start_codon:yes stop_codon:yes gene_type:complete